MGYEGAKNLPSIISSNIIIQYAEKCLETCVSEIDLLVSLIDASDENDIHDLLEKLSINEKKDYQIQYRKLRVYMVFCTINKISKDYFDGLLELSELWISLGMPQDCPVFIQGYNNSFTPQDFYNKSTYDYIMTRTKEWINKEKMEIIAAEEEQM